MQPSILTSKTGSFYAACSPELEVICYGQCRDEALNNLAAEIRERKAADAVLLRVQTVAEANQAEGRTTGDERNHA